MKLKILILLCSLFSAFLFGQNQIDIDAKFDVANKIIEIKQHIRYQNTSNDTLKTIFLNDWNNAYSAKTTPLAQRFTEEFSTKFHFAKSEDRGYTAITSVVNEQQDSLAYTRLKNHPDVLEVTLERPLLPSEYYDIYLNYNSKIPNETFTNYGATDDGQFFLKYWYITPAVYDGAWHYYSNKNLDDLYVPPADTRITAEFPVNYTIYSELDRNISKRNDSTQTLTLYGKNRVDTKLYLSRFPSFKYTQTDKFTLITDIKEGNIEPSEKALANDKIVHFIDKNLGAYPHNYLMVTDIEYGKDQLYGLNQLPSFLRPFPNNLQYELKILKIALNNYLNNTLLLNPRKDYWLKDGLQVYYLMKYVEENYPDLKLLGTLSRFWGVRSFHAADLYFNEQYNMFYTQMARTNRDQSLLTSKDSLLKFNSNIAGKYKAGVGLKYLDEFVNNDILETTIYNYLETSKLQITSSSEFEIMLKENTDKDVDWFFDEYISTRKKIDFKIKELVKTEDSITLTIKNKRHNTMPISLYTMSNDSVMSRQWIENIQDTKTLTIPRNDIDKLVLNYENTVPEYNLRDNWKSLKGFFFNNKPLQFRLFQDVEDPNYNQVFVMPLIEFDNIYDGLTLGAKFYNKTLLRKNLSYKFSPQYATKSKTFTGGASAYYTHNLEDSNLYSVAYGIGAGYSSFAENAFVTKITPSLSFNFRNDDDFRSNERSSINLRYIDISRTVKDNPLVVITEPDYRVLSLRYFNSNSGIIKHNSWLTDFQVAKNFGKVAVNYEYRKLSESNRQFNFRFFAGTFLYNNTNADSNYFSFALDRPTDYLFDYNYLGRSEQSGIFSQQIIIAEGGFKSKLRPAFANQWMTTVNTSASIWKYVEAYGDLGLVKNRGNNAAFVYDSGIRLNLVTDYFELYFPVYSNLGWEIAQKRYDQKIRIKFTLDPGALLGLFRRKWY
ncbi:MAG: metalloprotease [Aquaticitalea sp.]